MRVYLLDLCEPSLRLEVNHSFLHNPPSTSLLISSYLTSMKKAGYSVVKLVYIRSNEYLIHNLRVIRWHSSEPGGPIRDVVLRSSQ